MSGTLDTDKPGTLDGNILDEAGGAASGGTQRVGGTLTISV